MKVPDKSKPLIIIANSKFPFGYANSVNVFRMTTAFAKAGYQIRLIAFRSRLMLGQNVLRITCRRYGDNPQIKSHFLWWPFSKGSEIFITLFSSLYLIFSNRKKIIFTRVKYTAYLSAFLKYQTIYECHAPPKSILQIIIDKFLIKSKMVKFIVISSGLKSQFQSMNIDTKKMIIAHDGGRMLFSPPHPDNFKKPCRQIGYIGSLYKGRGLEIILKLAKIMQNYNFHVIGDLDAISHHPTPPIDNIYYYDTMTPNQAEHVTNLFDALLMPYQSEVKIRNNTDTSRWMSPMKMFEYMLSGVPIISSDLPALREILINEVDSLMVEPNNLQKWKNALERFNDNQLRYKLASNAYKKASSQFTWDIRLKIILSALNS